MELVIAGLPQGTLELLEGHKLCDYAHVQHEVLGTAFVCSDHLSPPRLTLFCIACSHCSLHVIKVSSGLTLGATELETGRVP